LHTSLRSFAAAASLVLLAGCGVSNAVGHQMFGLDDSSSAAPGATPTVFGYAVADEPQAAIAARQILNQGGNAADAAAAAGFAQAVTLPSRGGLGGGGACLVKMFDSSGKAQPPVALLFPAGAPGGGSGDRPAAVPTLARGLFALQARFGVLPSAAVIVPAERLAASAELSPALEYDLQTVGPALLADPAAAAVFAPNGGLLPANANLVQPDLAATLEVLRTQGLPGFYAGSFAQSFTTAADAAGGGLTLSDLANGAPQFTNPDISTAGAYNVASLPVATSPFEELPASAAFMALDKNGGSVICVTSMNNLFGTGRIAAGTGVLLAASPRTNPTPDLAAAMAYVSGNLNFRAAASGTGQSAAAQAAQIAITNALSKTQSPIPSPGRANIISCPGNVPGGEATCTATADPQGQGLAIGGR
jgi:gamma-glutamyltranspeptidase/glutathione hydrolase